MKNDYMLQSQTLSLEAFSALVYEEALSIVVEDFYPQEALHHLTSKLTDSDIAAKALDGGAPINRLGRPWFTSKHGEAHETEYFEAAQSFHSYMMDLCHPYMPPADLVTRYLDHLWPGGAKIGKMDGRTMCAGLVRDISDGKSLPWHVDANRFGPDGRRGTQLDNANAILFGNVYIVCDTKTGSLQCCDRRPNPLAYRKLNDLGYGTSDNMFAPDVDYQPVAGALVMGHADKWHRVLSTDSRRITSSFFVAVYDEDQPLIVYS